MKIMKIANHTAIIDGKIKLYKAASLTRSGFFILRFPVKLFDVCFPTFRFVPYFIQFKIKQMKKITIASIAFMALIVLLIAATPKKEMPPNFETAYTTFVDALNDYVDARAVHSIDTVSTKAAFIIAANYLHSHWTAPQVSDNVDALWPMPVVFVYACQAHCAQMLSGCIRPVPGHGDEITQVDFWCVYQYEQCKANCH